MVHAEGAAKELNNVTISYSQLLQAHAEVRLEGMYQLDISAFLTNTGRTRFL